jgi:hypothetical protein
VLHEEYGMTKSFSERAPDHSTTERGATVPAALIDWSYDGRPDLSAGTGATAIERAIPWLSGSVLAAWLTYGVWASESQWTALQWIVGLFIAVDVGGGVVANALNSCKRFYHTPLKADERGFTALAKNHYAFAGFHVHTVVVAACWAPAHLWLGIAWYVALCASAVLVLVSPLYLRRPLATLFVAGAIVVATTFTPIAGHFEWLVPLLFLKIVLGHAVREEPYRPTPGATHEGEDLGFHGERRHS